MVAGSGDTKEFSKKPLVFKRTFQPGNPKAWRPFKGELRSTIDANALTALDRRTAYTMTEIRKIAPNVEEQERAEMLYKFNLLFEDANEYIYKNIYANIDFDVPSHGPSLMNLISEKFEAERNGIELYYHLAKSDRTGSETGQAALAKLVTPDNPGGNKAAPCRRRLVRPTKHDCIRTSR